MEPANLMYRYWGKASRDDDHVFPSPVGMKCFRKNINISLCGDEVCRMVTQCILSDKMMTFN